ncbi:IclR family transcriptional regulator [Cucumibacter marinus]|uniref:IclR family transcriptional regulator n=1 Tax=Cucumibacter marinus TaxID=1121252 RepID=UPI0003FA0AD6|nr:helix-turn-helix domain-containing protein [Cucumibacter marinus]
MTDPANDTPARAKGVQSVDMSGVILEALCTLGRAAPLKDIAAEAGMPAAKVHRYMASLVRIGLASQNPATGHYDLGPLARRLGVAAIARDMLVERAGVLLEKLAAEFGTTGHLAVWGDRGPVIIKLAHGGTPVVSSLGIGASVPLLRSATGRVFVALMPEGATAELVAQEKTDKAISASEREAILAPIRETRVAHIEGALVPGLAAISGAITEIDGSLACSLTLVTTEPGRFDPGTNEAERFTAAIAAFNAGREH